MYWTYPWDSRPDFFGQLLHVGALPAGWEVHIPIARVRLPPERRVHRGTATQNTALQSVRRNITVLLFGHGGHASDVPTSHDASIIAGDTIRICPNLVEKTRYIETSQIGALQPCGFHCSVPSTARWRTLFEKKDGKPGLAQAVGDRNASRAGADYNVVERASRGRGTIGILALDKWVEKRRRSGQSKGSRHLER